jgi:hypothetical protein
MMQIIDGRRYSTETAHFIVYLPCWHYRSDFGWHETALYRSPKGQFFIAGHGNAASLWASDAGNGSRGPGSGLRLVSETDARAFMESAGCDDEDFARVGLGVVEG